MVVRAVQARRLIVGGVFINYRNVDDPLGAASIRERLVLTFGRENVFRDSDSLQPGGHYPTGIRAALWNASVVVAVIGPRWLTLTDETSVRLIDRERDWVRQELATAFTQGIPVLPVLLKDTPANAVMPTTAQLPEEIRTLASIQAMELSHRRLGDDLDRLVLAVSRLGRLSAPTALPEEQRLFFAMVDALAEIPALATEQDRAAIINQLSRPIADSVAYNSRRRAHVMNLLLACRAHRGGVNHLIQVLLAIEGDDCLPLLQLIELAKGTTRPE